MSVSAAGRWGLGAQFPAPLGPGLRPGSPSGCSGSGVGGWGLGATSWVVRRPPLVVPSVTAYVRFDRPPSISRPV
ncbi:hypothetical protein, partial [Streptomyces mirabilis]|uniref:hypothetical protein n=1 Tax=Streptomyces mirabilis TaxID=68239 RepID=UPI00331D0A0C